MFSEDGYRALTAGAAVVRRADRGVLAVTGADRLTWLQGLVTNDVLALPPGGTCDAAYLTPQGRMITDLRVVNLETETLLDVPATLSAALAARMDALLFSEDAHIADVSPTVTVVEVHGPASPDVMPAPPMIRDDVFAMPGYVAVVDRKDVDGFIQTVVNRGAVETTLATLEVVRIEAGRPAFLIDMDEHTIPLEAGLEHRAISFTKGCYVGQEVIVRVMHRGGGRVAKRLVGLRLSGAEVPGPGAEIRVGGRAVGKVTSAVWSPACAGAIALGYVHRDFVEPGTDVEIEGKAHPNPARVAALPFVSRESRKP